MKICKKCEKTFEPTKGLVNYCSIECRNSRDWSDDDKIKKSESAKNSEKVMFANKNNPKTRISNTKEFWFKIKQERQLKRKEFIMNQPYEGLKFEMLRERVIYEQNCKCNKCGLDEWLGEKITLELEHKDGNHFNNHRDNLEMLCPNCHATTETWRGRNKANKNIGKVTDERLLEVLILNNWNMRKSLIDVDLAAKGGNYKRCHKLKKEYEEITNMTS